MTPGEFREFLTIAKDFQLRSLKLGDMHVEFGGATSQLPTPNSISEISQTALSPEVENEIKHKTEQLASLLKLDDRDLISQLFPEPQTETA